MPSLSPRMKPAQHQNPDDEITPIISAHRGSANDYSTASPTRHSPTRSSSNTAGSRKRKNDDTAATAVASHDGGVPDADSPSWFRQLVDKYGAVELDNKGSVARDHLALERTFLAWLRTSLSFASIGIAITQLFRLNTTITDSSSGTTPSIGSAGTSRLRAMGKPLGATFLGISILVLLVGWRRYFESQHWIIRGKFPASRGSIVLVTGITAVLVVASLVIVISVGATQFEKRGEGFYV